VPAGDEEAFVAACERVLGNAGLRARLGQAGLVAAEGFDSARMVDRYDDLLAATVASRMPAGAPEPALET
jgi:glycosyltransferase involved in cell wall biosynthesis